MTAWTYKDVEFTEEQIGDSYGYIYKITNLVDNREYIGRKYFSKASYKTVKGKRKKVRKPSDWLDYWSSSEELKADVERLGKENFKREILHLCKTRSECNYLETYEIFVRGALLSERYYNSWVSAKIHKKHVLNKVKDIHGSQDN